MICLFGPKTHRAFAHLHGSVEGKERFGFPEHFSADMGVMFLAVARFYHESESFHCCRSERAEMSHELVSSSYFQSVVHPSGIRGR